VSDGAPRPALLLVAIALVTGASLAAEVLYMRLLAIVHWQQFAYMIISLALLGYGVSGTLLTLARTFWLRHAAAAFVANAFGLAISIPLAFRLAEALPFNGLAIVWEPSQLLYLAALYLLLAVPFLFAANCVALPLMALPGRIRFVYLADLVGAGAGALGVLALLDWLPGERLLLVLAGIAALGALAGGFAWCARRGAAAAVTALLAIALAGAGFAAWPPLEMTPYKGLAQAREVVGAQVLGERYGPAARLTFVRSPDVPFRHAPGLSLHSSSPIAEQIGVFMDGEGPTPIVRHTRDAEPPAYLDAMPSALPYHLRGGKPSVLILGAAGGAGVLQARLHDAVRIEAVERSAELIDAVRTEYAAFAGHLYERPGVDVRVGEARSRVTRMDTRFDVIQIAMLQSFGAAAAGTHSLTEGYTFTVEAFVDYLDGLTEQGILAVTQWLKVPPRHSLKLAATAIEALHRTGIEAPGRHLAMIRTSNTATLAVKREPLSAAEIARLRTFAERRAFDLVHHPGMGADEANRYNVWPEANLHRGVQALLGADAEGYIERYKFDIAPATDDRPYFHNVFRWRLLPELLRMGAQAGPMLLESGYLILCATLVQAVVAGALLIVTPLSALRGGERVRVARGRAWPVLVYFGAIGLGFLFVEIAFIQKLVLFLGHPVYAVGVALGGFLVFAGLGSGFAERILARLGGSGMPAAAACAVLIALLALYLLALPATLAYALGWPAPVRMALGLGVIAPVAFTMGLFFPLGLIRVSDATPQLVPWAWGINGCASVVSAVLATLLALHFGFNAVVIAALGLYGLATLVSGRLQDRGTQALER